MSKYMVSWWEAGQRTVSFVCAPATNSSLTTSADAWLAAASCSGSLPRCAGRAWEIRTVEACGVCWRGTPCPTPMQPLGEPPATPSPPSPTPWCSRPSAAAALQTVHGTSAVQSVPWREESAQRTHMKLRSSHFCSDQRQHLRVRRPRLQFGHQFAGLSSKLRRSAGADTRRGRQ